MAQLRAETLEHLGIEDTDLDATGSANLDLLINRSWWNVIDEYKFKEKNQYDTFVTIVGTRSYSLSGTLSPVPEAIRNVSITDTNDQHVPLDSISQEYYESQYNEQSTVYALPEKYFHFGGNLYLYPTPDAVYTITVAYDYILDDLTAGNPAIPRDWHEVILYGAVHRGFLRARDFKSSGEYLNLFNGKIAGISSTDAKEDSFMQMAGVRAIRPTYSVRK